MGTSTSQLQPHHQPQRQLQHQQGPGSAGSQQSPVSTETAPGGDRRSQMTARLLGDITHTCDDLKRKRLQDEVVVLNMAVATAISARYRGLLEPSDEVEFDVISTEVVEQPSAVAEEDLNQVDLHLVHLPGSEKRLGRACPMDHPLADIESSLLGQAACARLEPTFGA